MFSSRDTPQYISHGILRYYDIIIIIITLKYNKIYARGTAASGAEDVFLCCSVVRRILSLRTRSNNTYKNQNDTVIIYHTDEGRYLYQHARFVLYV